MKINKCPKCGARLPEDSEFCIRCGEIFDLKMVDDKILKKEEIIELYMGNTRIMKIKAFLFNYLYFFYKRAYFAGFLSFFLITLIIMNFNILSYTTSYTTIENVSYSIFYYFIFILTFICFIGLTILNIFVKKIIFENGLKYTLFTLSINSDKNYNDVKDNIIKDINSKKINGIIICVLTLAFHLLLGIMLL